MANIGPVLQGRIDAATEAVTVVAETVQTLPGLRLDNEPQLHAILLYASISQLFSGCILLAAQGEPTAIPIVLRSLYEALVDLDNLVHDKEYVDHMKAANAAQQLKILKSDSLRAELQDKYKEEYASFEGELARLKAEKKGPLHIRDRLDMAGRLHEYDSSYGLFCLDSHNNTAALAERGLYEKPDGTVGVSLFGEHDPEVTARRLNLGLSFLLQAARMMHGAFETPAAKIDELWAKLELHQKNFS